MQDCRHRRVDCRAVLGHGRRCELPGPFGTSTASSTTTLKSGVNGGPLGPEHQRDGRNVRARALDHRAFRPGADHRQLQRRQGDESERGQGGRDRLDRVRTRPGRCVARDRRQATGVRLPGQRCSGRLRLGQPRLRLQYAWPSTRTRWEWCTSRVSCPLGLPPPPACQKYSMFTLPAGYRPVAKTIAITLAGDPNQVARIDILPDGA